MRRMRDRTAQVVERSVPCPGLQPHWQVDNEAADVGPTPRLERRKILAREHFVGPEFEGEEDVFEFDKKAYQAAISLEPSEPVPHTDLEATAGGGMSEWMRRVETFSQELLMCASDRACVEHMKID